MNVKDEYGPVDGRCKTGYHKHKTTKMCVAVKHKTKKNTKLANCIKKCPNPLQEYGPARTRCRKGYIKNKTSKMCQDPCVKQCQDTHDGPSTPIARITPDGFEYGPKKGRCKTGYHKNKTTKMCVKGPAKNISKAKTISKTKKLPITKTPSVKHSSTPGSKAPIVIKDTTPPELFKLSEEVKASLSQKKPISITRLKSYSPAINAQLITKHLDDKADIFGTCKVLERYGPNMFKSRRLTKPKIWNGTKCINFDTKEAQIILLSNLASTKLAPIETIIAPKQYRSNCWFNTMYMIFFVSDKGRKFFKFFRQLMIEGNTLRSGLVKKPNIPSRLWKAFALLNMAIEATLTGYNIMEFDTNTVIDELYKTIPTHRLYPVDRAGNPTVYYDALMAYLRSGNNIMMKRQFYGKAFDQLQKRQTTLSSSQPFPEVIQVNIKTNIEVKKEFTVYNDKNEPQKYELDSAAIIDTLGHHFCCLITYDKTEYGFDGASFKRLNPFNWKDLINRNQDWTFLGSRFKPSNIPVLWNFKNGYVELFYYRV